MHRLPASPAALMRVSLAVAVLAVGACAKVENPSGPSQSTFPTVTITANGIPADVPFLVPGSPVRIVNNDSRPHRMHLDFVDQAGCTAFETSGEIAPGESRLTAPIGLEVVDCAIHDHMSHGDTRFAVRLRVDDGE